MSEWPYWFEIAVVCGLPKKGINGWTAEPREKYYALRGWKWPPDRN